MSFPRLLGSITFTLKKSVTSLNADIFTYEILVMNSYTILRAILCTNKLEQTRAINAITDTRHKENANVTRLHIIHKGEPLYDYARYIDHTGAIHWLDVQPCANIPASFGAALRARG